MPRPRSISYKKRVEIFLDYRRSRRKVYPVSKTHDVARSTVTLIVNEFREAGFSDQPRLSLSSELLEQAQIRHQCEVVEEFKSFPGISVAEPAGNVKGGINDASALAENAENIIREKQVLGLSPALVWHLAETQAEETLRAVGKSIIEYNVLCFDLWQGIRGNLEEQSGCPVAEARGSQDKESGGQLYPVLVDEIYRRFCSHPIRRELPPPEWPRLKTRQNSGMGEIELDSTAVARVDKGHQDLAGRVRNTVHDHAGQYLEDAKRLFATYGDLRYVLSYAQEVVRQVQPEQVRIGICPDCPYPESSGKQQGASR